MSLVRSRSQLRLVALAAAMATLAALGPVAAARPASVLAEDPTPLGSSVTIHGRGDGHGVGMNQYGARGRAIAGATATENATVRMGVIGVGRIGRMHAELLPRHADGGRRVDVTTSFSPPPLMPWAENATGSGG